MNQLTLFEIPIDKEYEFEKMKKEWEKTRRSLYARKRIVSDLIPTPI